MALAPCNGSTSSRRRPSSQTGGGLSTMPSQSSSTGAGTPPSPWGSVTTTSIAPGFTLGSQSLQSPSATVNPSWSASLPGTQSIEAPVLAPMVTSLSPPDPCADVVFEDEPPLPVSTRLLATLTC